jgi:glycosyltransferase involved in cell wall biosynthesis
LDSVSYEVSRVPPSLREERGTAVAPAAARFKISVIIPLFNGEAYIAEALGSVLAQQRPADEIIVVDDGSTDGGAAIVERIGASGIVKLIRKPNGGQSSARNLGIKHSTGDLIALLDQDDVWYPNHLAEMAVPFLEPQLRPLGWVYSNADEIDWQGRMVRHSCLRVFPFHHPKTEVFTCLGYDMFVLPSSSLFLKEAFENVGGFDETLSGYEDDDFFLRLFRAGYGNVFIDWPLTKWRIHPQGSSWSYRMVESRARYLRKLLQAFPDDLERGRDFARGCLVPRFFPMAVKDVRLALKSGRRSSGRPRSSIL